ncbi:GNAT family N-acetyltransferase [Desulfonatronovibrio hydrogenovorans]|uniref:GNAT family N-acetyltransferase n=1 Tax=Desulfonatronovibrio hydrogenovorans TaxID=53245 RepID=UPI001376AF06|nr:GNAT family N-acetyltransferase [Desulfonatronovibrio hydrogenovorans]
MNNITIDDHVDCSLPDQIQDLLVSTGTFSREEIRVAKELIRECLEKGNKKSGYHFLLAKDTLNNLAGYTCFGPVPFTRSGFDLYWMAVRREFQGAGLGRKLYLATEQAVKKMNGNMIYVETSGRQEYHPARLFYQQMGFSLNCTLVDFYAPGDHKLIYSKQVLSALI